MKASCYGRLAMSSRSVSLLAYLMSTHREIYSTYSMFQVMPDFPQWKNNVNNYVILHSRHILDLNDFLEHLLIMTQRKNYHLYKFESVRTEFCFCLCKKVSQSRWYWPQIGSAAQTGLELTTLLPQPRQWWESRHRPPVSARIDCSVEIDLFFI